ncbi:hypothetical protein D9619_000039 [Psilocybe cf. subviscida]|uniref:Uncharacterized protein n=1 Tax=Psilocybe cf. subviscida TaxID=2480587 RepID=A0A8H5BEP1_9AGAR|nr:hypothetical protein D9619_000039 [Psilocybe cf. subviscida]
MSKVVIDDSDSSIVWTGPWIVGGNTALVTFTGTSITVYGTIPKLVNNVSSISQYSLDGGPVAGTFAPPPSPVVRFQQKFFTSPDLLYGMHQLHVLDTISSDGLWLDFFVVTTGLDSGALSVTSAEANGLPRPAGRLNSSTLSGSTTRTNGFMQSITALKPSTSSVPVAHPRGPEQPTESTLTSSKAYSESWIIAVSLAVSGCALFMALIVTVYSLRRLRSSLHGVHAAEIPEPFTVSLEQSLSGDLLCIPWDAPEGAI